MGLPIAAAAIAAALGIAPVPPLPGGRYTELVLSYASPQRAEAVAGIGALDEDALRSGVEGLRGQPAPLLRAALMLHTDRRLLERPALDATETIPACESIHTQPAAHAAQLLMLDPAGTDFVRRWSIAIALQDHWDGCFADALRWIDTGARWFPNDAQVLLVRGALHETIAALPSPLPRLSAVTTQRSQQAIFAANAERAHLLNEARRSLERAVDVDPALELARLRLGRILWRLGKGEAARVALESVLARSRDDAVVHLAHLFIARVHQDAGRHDAALREYRAALELEPTSQAAAMGLSDALQLAGEAEAARAAVERALVEAGRRPHPQPFWEYAFGNSRHAAELLDRLREEVER